MISKFSLFVYAYILVVLRLATPGWTIHIEQVLPTEASPRKFHTPQILQISPYCCLIYLPHASCDLLVIVSYYVQSRWHCVFIPLYPTSQ